jgi:putative transposase
VGQIPRKQRRDLIEKDLEKISLRRQCELLDVNRSTLYYGCKESENYDINLLNEVRDIWQQYPFYGYRRITKELRAKGYEVNKKRVQRLMVEGGIRAIFPGPNTSRRNKLHAVHPYLLKDLVINRANQAWMVDITYLKLHQGFVYLVALIDVYSRYVVGWSISNTLETSFCIDAVRSGLMLKKPEIINSDQGCQFTSDDWVNFLKENTIKISMTGKGRCNDNIYIERFWRTIKQEEFYINEYRNLPELRKAIGNYIEFYNNKRWHQSLDYKRPAEVYFSGKMRNPVDMWTSPSDQPAPFGTCG